MAETTVRELADVVGIPVNRLLAQLGESGLPHTEADQRINDQEKAQLFTHLRRLHGKSGGEIAAPRKIALKRKSVSELKIASSQGRRKTVTVETRRRRSYTPGGAAARDDSGTAVAGEESTAKARMDAAKRALQEEAKRRQQELDETLRGEAEVREKEEALRKLREPEKKKRAPVEEPAPEPAPEPADAQAAAAAPVAIPPPPPLPCHRLHLPARKRRPRPRVGPMPSVRSVETAAGDAGSVVEKVARNCMSRATRRAAAARSRSRVRWSAPSPRATASRCRPRPSFGTWRFPRRSRWESSRRRCRSRPTSSSRR